jgi:glycosyltransferase involved in cell wall biosynthesis
MSIKKIVHIHFGKEGGAERFFVNLVNSFSDQGIEQRFVVRPGRLWTEEVRKLGPIITSNYRPWSPMTPLLTWRTARMIRRWQPDVVMAWMSRASRLMPSDSNTLKLTRLGDYPRHLKNFENIDCIIGITPDISDECVRLGWQKPTAMIPIYPRDVALRPVPRADMNTPDDAFVVVGSGRFIRRKGFDSLIRAVSQVPGAYLWLVGDGEKRGELETLVTELDMMERTRFTGWVTEAMHYVAAGDVFVMPSRHEPLGNVIMEAWRSQTPSVFTRAEGPSWCATDERNCLMVDIDDDRAMASAITRIREDGNLARKLVDGGTDALRSHFNKDIITSSYLELFEDMNRFVRC